MKISKVFRYIASGIGILSCAVGSFACCVIFFIIFAFGLYYVVYMNNVTSRFKARWKAEVFFDNPTDIALCQAINRFDIAEIDKLITRVDVNKRGIGGMTFLLWAYPTGEASFKRILEHGGDPNVVYTHDFGYSSPGGGLKPGDTLIFLAMYSTAGPRNSFSKYKKPFENYMQLLIDHGANINFQRRIDGATPLHHAVFSQNRKAIRQLIESGADLNLLNDEGETPIMQRKNDLVIDCETVLLLLEAGADYRIVDKNNYTIAHHVARGVYGRTPQTQVYYNNVVKWLADRDISVERAGEQVDTWQQRREAVKNDYFQRRIPDEVIYGDDIPEGSQAPPPGPSTLTKERLDEYVNNAP